MTELPSCIFCKIANHTAPANISFEDDDVIVFQDLFPNAPVHMQVIPKIHITSVNELTEEHTGLIAKLVFTAKQQAQSLGIAESGYKLVWNTGKDGGQVVPHLHIHLMGGGPLAE